MLYYLLYPLHTTFSVFNVFRYITFRTALAILTALVISFFLTPNLIKKFNDWKLKSDKREDVPERHDVKKGTPTMGGFIILISTIIPTLLWADLKNSYIWVVTFALLSFGAIGFMDDLTKLRRKQNGKGISGKSKLLLQLLFGIMIAVFLYLRGDFITQLTIPFFKNVAPDLGIFYILLCIFIIVGTSNSVNLTDGLDGLAIGPVLTVCSTFLLFAYLVGNIKFAQYLQIFYVKGAGNLRFSVERCLEPASVFSGIMLTRLNFSWGIQVLSRWGLPLQPLLLLLSRSCFWLLQAEFLLWRPFR